MVYKQDEGFKASTVDCLLWDRMNFQCLLLECSWREFAWKIWSRKSTARRNTGTLWDRHRLPDRWLKMHPSYMIQIRINRLTFTDKLSLVSGWLLIQNCKACSISDEWVRCMRRIYFYTNDSFKLIDLVIDIRCESDILFYWYRITEIHPYPVLTRKKSGVNIQCIFTFTFLLANKLITPKLNWYKPWISRENSS